MAIVAAFAFAYLANTQLFGELTVDAVVLKKDFLVHFYESHPAMTVILYVALYVVSTALTIPVAVPLSVVGGMLFGLSFGTLLVSFSSTIGATLSFLGSRYLFRGIVERKFPKQVNHINKKMGEEGIYYLFIVRLVPIFPFFLLNLLLGITAIRTRDYIWVSLVGMLAGTIVYVNAGAELGKIQSYDDILSPGLILAFFLIGILPLLAKKISLSLSKGVRD